MGPVRGPNLPWYGAGVGCVWVLGEGYYCTFDVSPGGMERGLTCEMSVNPVKPGVLTVRGPR